MHPGAALKLSTRLLHGKEAFKAFVTESVSLDVAHLPYNRGLVQYLNHERARPRHLSGCWPLAAN
jgi:hypothetical protein